jgi:hypothetical protein
VALLSHYLVQRPELDAPRFLEDYRRLAAQRHAKVLGIFVRLAGRDGKHGYLAHLPRTLGLFVRALNAEALAPLREWLDRHLPGWREPCPPRPWRHCAKPLSIGSRILPWPRSTLTSPHASSTPNTCH